MNRKKLYLYICISLALETQITFHKNLVYASDNKKLDKVHIIHHKSDFANLKTYTVDSSWTVIDSASISGESLNKYISNCIAEGKNKFYIKNGEYILDDNMVINSPDVIIQGESKENTKIIQNNSAINAITVTEDNVEVSDLTIDSTRGRIAFSTSDDKKINNVNLHDCIIKSSSNVFAVAFYGTVYTNDKDDNKVVENDDLAVGNIIENNEIYSESSDSPTSEKDGVLFTKQKNGLIRNNKIYGRRIAFYLSRNCKVTNNEIHDSSTNGIRCTVPACDNEISGNTIGNSKASGICLNRNNGAVSGDYRASNITIENNTITDSKYFGIEINNLKDSHIDNNKLFNIAFYGIYMVLSDNLNVNTNEINNCSLSTVDGSDWEWDKSWNSGIFLDSDVKDSIFDSNKIINSDTVSCPYGIGIQPGRNNINNKVINNTIKGYFIRGIYSEAEYISDNEIDLIPWGLKAEDTDKNKIQINWNSVYPVDGYNIYRSDSENGNYIKINDSVVAAESYIDTGLEPGKTYYYKIAAVPQQGKEWTKSSIASASTKTEAKSGGGSGQGTGGNGKSEIVVKRIYGNNRMEISLETARKVFKNEKPTAVVLASEASFPDALSGSVLAYKNNAPLLLVGKSVEDSREVLNYILSNLEKGCKIYILGGTAAVSIEISNYLDREGYYIIRLGGQDRYETNYKIIDSLHVAKGTPIIIASGSDFQDSLGILNTACIREYPILISTGNTLSTNAIEHIRSIQPDKVYVIGRNQILSYNLEDEIKKLTQNARIIRLGGSNEYETSVKIVDEFNINSDSVTIASGIDFSNAVTGSILAAKNNSNMMLVNNNNAGIWETVMKYHNIRNLIILGGEKEIDVNAVSLLKKMILE